MAKMSINATPWFDFLDRRSKNLKVNRTLSIIRLGEAGMKAMESQLPHGRLRKSIGDPANEGIYKLTTRGDYIVLLIGTKVPYCVYVNRGIPTFYPIVAKNKKTLKFFWDKVDKVVYLKAVKHPPVKGKFYLEHGFNAVIRELNKEVTRIF